MHIGLSRWKVPDADFSYFAWARVWQMMGLPLLFIPINIVAYAGLPAEKTNQASALINVARNLAGGIEVSLANAVVAQARLVPSSAADRASRPVLVEPIRKQIGGDRILPVARRFADNRPASGHRLGRTTRPEPIRAARLH